MFKKKIWFLIFISIMSGGLTIVFLSVLQRGERTMWTSVPEFIISDCKIYKKDEVDKLMPGEKTSDGVYSSDVSTIKLTCRITSDGRYYYLPISKWDVSKMILAIIVSFTGMLGVILFLSLKVRRLELSNRIDGLEQHIARLDHKDP